MTKNGKKSNVVLIESIPSFLCFCYLYISVVEYTYGFIFSIKSVM